MGAEGCTGRAAMWCSTCGDCTCPDRPVGDGARGERTLDDPAAAPPASAE